MNNTTLEIIIKARDEASAKLGQFKSKMESLEPTFQKMAVTGGAAFTAISGFAALSVNKAIKAQSAQIRLETLLRNTTGATNEQISALTKQANALQKVGVVSADYIKIAQGQLATFDLQASSIEALIPSILDYAVAEKGAAVSADELQQLTNGLAQALNGNFGSLTRTGFVLDENTKSMIANGTEAEKVMAITQVLDSTYRGFNATARETAEGSLLVLKNSLGDIAVTIGTALLPTLMSLVQSITPIISAVSGWAEENPRLLATLIIVGASISALVTGVGLLGLAIPIVTAGFAILIGTTGIVITTLGLLILTVHNVVKVVLLLKDNWETTMLGIKIITKETVDAITAFWTPLINVLDNIIGKMQAITSGVGSKVSSAFSSVSSFFTGRRAQGGNVAMGSSYLVGERGPELFTPSSSGMIQANGSFGGGGSVVVNINGGTYLSREVAKEIGDTIINDLKRVYRI